LHAYADAKLYDYSWESQLLFSDPWLTTSRLGGYEVAFASAVICSTSAGY